MTRSWSMATTIARWTGVVGGTVDIRAPGLAYLLSPAARLPRVGQREAAVNCHRAHSPFQRALIALRACLPPGHSAAKTHIL